MPELPEVETVKAALVPVMAGGLITKAEIRRPDLRWPLPAGLQELLTGAHVKTVARRAKILLLELDHHVVLWHLGMSGSVRISAHKPNSQLHDHVEFEVEKEGHTHFVTFHDPRRFGYMDVVETATLDHHRSLVKLGPEPVAIEGAPLRGPLLDLAYLRTILAPSQKPIKTFLLDQEKIAGLGNIYVCEALFRAGISPRRKACNVKGVKIERLFAAITDVLHEAIAQGGTSLRDHKQPDGKLGYFVQQLAVYGRQGQNCVGCDAKIVAIVQSGRSSFYCPHCQR